MFSNTGSMFGSKPFGSTTSSGGLFGNTTSSNATSFGFGSAVVDAGPEGTTIPFEETRSTDSAVRNGVTKDISTKLMCITAMDKYKARCLEELRVYDYAANRKGPQAGGNSFGQQPASGGLFGQSKPSMFGTSTQGSFGSTTNNAFGSATSAFGQAAKPAFGGSTATTTNLFGQSQSAANSNTSIFGQASKPAFGQTTTSAPLFGKTPAFGSTGASQTQTSLFPKPASNAFGQPAATPASTGFSFGGTTTTTATSFNAPFGSTNASTGNSIFKPAATGFGSGFGSSTTGTTGSSLFPNTSQQSGTNMFGSTAKPTGLFNQTSAAPFGGGNTSTGLFLGGAKPAAAPLFGGTTGSLGFGTQAQPQQTVMTQPASPPIVLGGNMDESTLQRKLIEAQLGSMPYGDSPLLKGKLNMSTFSPPASLSSSEDPDIQAKLKMIASQALVGCETSAAFNNGTPVTKLTNESLRSVLCSPQNSFSYKPLVPLPSLGFAPNERSSLNLSLRRSPPKIAPSNNVFDSPFGTASPKSFDPSVLKSRSKNNTPSRIGGSVGNVTDEVSTPVEGRRSVAFAATPEREPAGVVKPVRLDFENVNDSVGSVKSPVVTPQQPLKSILVKNENKKQRSEERRNSTSAAGSPVEIVSLPESPMLNSSRIAHLEAQGYFTDPPLRELEKTRHDGKIKIKDGLRIGRTGSGSVYFPGTFELSTLDLEKVIFFQAKEVIVYPDDATKPPIGVDLNRPAEISLERIWPYVKEIRAVVDDPVEIEKLRFVNRLELACQRMNATFINYDVRTGTWTFSVKHF